MSDDTQVALSEEAKLMDKDVLIGFGAVFAVIVLIVILLSKLFGGGAGSVSISQLDKWALSHNVTVSDGSVPQTSGQSGLVVRYRASDQKIDAMSIRLDLDAEERGHLPIVRSVASFFKIKWSNTKRKDRWHRYDHDERNTAFARELEESGMELMAGKTAITAVVEALNLSFVRTDDEPGSKQRGTGIEEWKIASVTERRSIWEREVKGLRLRLTFSHLMRGQAFVPSELDIAWGDAEFVEADSIYQDHPEIPYGVEGYSPFTPAPVAEHLRNGGVVWAAEASSDESWPGQVGYSQFFLYDKTGTKLEERVLVSWSCSSELVKSGIQWYEIHGPMWSSESTVQSMKYVKWEARRGGALVVLETASESFRDGKLSSTYTRTVENQLRFTSDRLGELIENVRTEMVFMQADIEPMIETKSKRQRLVRLTEARLVPDYGFAVK